MFPRTRRDVAAPSFAWLAAPSRGWRHRNMKSDWKVVVPFELPRP
jgi:hypothetical protein